jgi:hypothetical protein
MKTVALGVALLLSGCALAGLDGPEQQQYARNALAHLPENLAQGALNDLGRFGEGYSEGYASWQSSDQQWELLRIRQQLDRIEHPIFQ